MGTLYIVSTPIGNLDDITLRAVKILASVPVIACEDTRKTGFLLHEFTKRFAPLFIFNEASKPKLIAYNNENEVSRLDVILDYLENDHNVALVSDAGTPLISDPGFPLIRIAIKKGLPIVIVPGVNAAITALTASGLPANQFIFMGYPPEKESNRNTLLSDLARIGTESAQVYPTIIFYSAPHKLLSLLKSMKLTLGDISIVIARELTKIHEEFWRGSITFAEIQFSDPKGEFVVLFQLKKRP